VGALKKDPDSTEPYLDTDSRLKKDHTARWEKNKITGKLERKGSVDLEDALILAIDDHVGADETRKSDLRIRVRGILQNRGL
jgi:hypothetical protein